jgi:hypothetical protein
MPGTAEKKFSALLRALCVFIFAISLSDSLVYSAPPSNRWLIIVETSRAMQPRRPAAAQLAGNLILSGMNGQAHPGDTIGLWTFDKTLHSGEFPLQAWTPRAQRDIAEHTSLFLMTRKYENRANVDAVVSPMSDLVTNSEFITVVLISSGSEKIRGTPYSDAINAVYKKFQSTQEKAKMPFVTVLRAQGGHIADFKVSTPPSALEMPPLPPELQITNIVAERAPEPKPRIEIPPHPPEPVVIVAPPLIVHGKKPEPELISNSVAAVELPKTNQNTITSNVPAAKGASLKTNVSASQFAQTAATNQGTNQNVMNTQTGSAIGPIIFGTGGAILGIVGIGLALVLVRRSNHREHVSLITRSLGRDQSK